MNINKEQFTEWLESRESKEVVGYACNSHDCLIARYLWVVHRVTSKVTNLRTIVCDNYGNANIFDHPSWLVSFIDAVDAIGVLNPSIEAGQALVILKEIPR